MKATFHLRRVLEREVELELPDTVTPAEITDALNAKVLEDGLAGWNTTSSKIVGHCVTNDDGSLRHMGFDL